MGGEHVLSQKKVILSRKWDVIVILDACRYDVFKKLYGNRFNVLKAETSGTCTMEWFYNTFKDAEMKDTIYVSGSPYIGTHAVNFKEMNIKYFPPRIFKKVMDVWRFAFKKIACTYTVDPQIVYEFFIIAFKLHFPSRFIVHFVQPHAPYPHCEELAQWFIANPTCPDKYLWGALRRGKADVEVARKCYEQNLRWVMQYVSKILDIAKQHNLRVIITSDHGEAFGEYGDYNHPCASKNPYLKYVPLVYLKDGESFDHDKLRAYIRGV